MSHPATDTNKKWYFEFNFPNAEYTNYLHELVKTSEVIAEIPCVAKVSNEFQYEPVNPTFTLLQFMKNNAVDAEEDDYYLLLSNDCFNNSIHYSLKGNELEFFKIKVFGTNITSMWSGILYHELMIYSKYEGTYEPFFQQVYSFLTDGEIHRPIPPEKRQLYTLCIEARYWKRSLKKKVDQGIKILIIRCPEVDKFKQHIKMFGNLKVLDLSCNEILYMPLDFGTLQIRELYLANNSIGTSDDWGWLTGKKICFFLRILDLSNNEITICPSSIGRLNLEVLDLSDNKLREIPHSIGRMHGLRCLKLARNLLQVLPEALFRIPIKFLDLSGNNLTNSDENHSNPPDDYRNVPSLINTASGCMINNHVYCSEVIPEIIEKILDNITRCYCGKPANENIMHVCRVNCRCLFPVVVYQGPRVFGLNVEFFCCSTTCYIPLTK